MVRAAFLEIAHMLTSLAAALVAATLAIPALPPHQSPAQEPPARTTSERPAPLNLNAATEAQLEALPGIGPATATRILEYRKKNGAFKKVEELMNVKGIGEKSFLKLKGLITVAPSRPEA
jgi:competence protein ComEA